MKRIGFIVNYLFAAPRAVSLPPPRLGARLVPIVSIAAILAATFAAAFAADASSAAHAAQKRAKRRNGGAAPSSVGSAAAASAAARSGEEEREAESDDVPGSQKSRYRINISLDFDNRVYSGTERVRWVNRHDRPTSQIYFHLYPNKHSVTGTPAPANGNAVSALSADEAKAAAARDQPRLEIKAVRHVGAGGAKQPLSFSLDEHGTLLRVNLREGVAPNAAAEVEIAFAGAVPEVEADETTLLAHVMQQINSVFRSDRETRQSRDINFSCRGVMLLGALHPLLAARSGDEWKRKTETSVGDFVFADAADYEVTVEAAPGVRVFASGENRNSTSAAEDARAGAAHKFAGEDLRDFALIAGRTLRAEERAAGGVRVRSIYLAGHETIGRRVLAVAAAAAEVYAARFGPLPHQSINVAEAPLAARLGSADFSGLGCIASAYYVDFESQAMRNLPEIVLEQRASIEDSLEFTVAHVVAQQWWGVAVGNDPERAPVLDEALSNWSALLYYRSVYGDDRAEMALDDQLRGVYKVYRTFGGEDMTADRAARDYRNSFQYSAIVVSKGALMFSALRGLLGDERFFAALQSYYKANLREVAEMDDLRGAFVAEAALGDRRAVTRLFNRWLSEKRGDEDVAPPDPQLAAALGITIDPAKAVAAGGAVTPKGDGGNAFARLGKFFWRQMTRVR